MDKAGNSTRGPEMKLFNRHKCREKFEYTRKNICQGQRMTTADIMTMENKAWWTKNAIK